LEAPSGHYSLSFSLQLPGEEVNQKQRVTSLGFTPAPGKALEDLAGQAEDTQQKEIRNHNLPFL
jgi:hypothetical protein